MTILVEKINAYTRKGEVIGDVCEKCETAAKPIYHLNSLNFGLDIILCPTCLTDFQKKVQAISVANV